MDTVSKALQFQRLQIAILTYKKNKIKLAIIKLFKILIIIGKNNLYYKNYIKNKSMINIIRKRVSHFIALYLDILYFNSQLVDQKMIL